MWPRSILISRYLATPPLELILILTQTLNLAWGRGGWAHAHKPWRALSLTFGRLLRQRFRFELRTQEATQLKMELDKAQETIVAAETLVSKLDGEFNRWSGQVRLHSDKRRTYNGLQDTSQNFGIFLMKFALELKKNMPFAKFTPAPPMLITPSSTMVISCVANIVQGEVDVLPGIGIFENSPKTVRCPISFATDCRSVQ